MIRTAVSHIYIYESILRWASLHFLGIEILWLTAIYHIRHSLPFPWPSIKGNSLPAEDTHIPNFRSQSWIKRWNPGFSDPGSLNSALFS